MQHTTGNNPLLTKKVQEACIVILEHMQMHGLDKFYLAADQTDPTNRTQRRVLVYAAKGQQTAELENNLCKPKTPEKMAEHGLARRGDHLHQDLISSVSGDEL